MANTVDSNNTEVVLTMTGGVYVIKSEAVYSDSAGRMFFLDENEMQTHIVLLDPDSENAAEA